MQNRLPVLSIRGMGPDPRGPRELQLDPGLQSQRRSGRDGSRREQARALPLQGRRGRGREGHDDVLLEGARPGHPAGPCGLEFDLGLESGRGAGDGAGHGGTGARGAEGDDLQEQRSQITDHT